MNMAAIDQDSALSQLQSRAQVELLDAVDKLRRLGFQGDIGLPQLIVCGNQSSGKSSVLEAISRVRFPAKDVFCTSFATEVILRRAPRENFRVQIIPARGCDEARRAYLSSFELTTHSLSPDAIPKVIEEAGRHMQSGGQGTRFAEDILRVEISGPSQPHLTLVDLPGIIHTANRDQTDEDIDLVNRLVAEYMRQPQSIILSVVAADYDFANQVVLQRARQFDSVGRRTLGIITKPDRRDAGSAGEREYIELAQNRNISLELGWHVLRNRDFYSKNVDAESRDAEETRFFAHSSWRTLPQSSRGVDALRDKLKQILLRSIRNYLPGLLSDVSSRIEACQRNLDKLGKPRVTDAEQRQYLVTASCKLHSLIKDAVHGNYQDGFFEGLDEHPISSTRLRSTLKNAGWEFAVNMRIHGHLYGIVDESQKGPRTIAKRVDLRTAGAEGPLDSCGMPLTCSRRDYMNAIVQYMYGSQGCELPGAYSPHIVGDIFRCQSRPWQRIATNHAQYCWNLVQSFFSLAVLHVAPEHTADAMLQYVAEPLLQKALQQLQARVQELLKPYTKLHPVTYDEGYLSQVKAYESKRSEDPEGATSGERATHTPNSLEAQTILDRMQAYYKVSNSIFLLCRLRSNVSIDCTAHVHRQRCHARRRELSSRVVNDDMLTGSVC